MLNDFANYILERQEFGWFGYTKEGKQSIAPCGMKCRCKRRGRRCSSYHNGDCGRVLNCREKAVMCLIAQGILKGRGKKPPRRWRQLLRLYEKQYQKLQRPFKQEGGRAFC